MTRWSRDIFRWIRPHHVIKTIQDPSRAMRELKYRYTFTTKKHFLIDILADSPGRVEKVFAELSQKEFFSSIKSKVGQHKLDPGRGAMGDEADLLYCLVRLIKPAVMVETGVGAGYSTAHILAAMDMNNGGMLYSVDYHPENNQCGWAIPEQLNRRWHLTQGPSSIVLEPLLEKVKKIDIFLHDSDHSYENMMMEFRTAWPHLNSQGIFLAHDIGRNAALFDFLKEIDFPFWKVRTYPVLAGFRKF